MMQLSEATTSDLFERIAELETTNTALLEANDTLTKELDTERSMRYEAQSSHGNQIDTLDELLAMCSMALDILISDGYGETSHPVMSLREAIREAKGE